MAGERIKEAVHAAASRRRGKKLIKVEPKPTTFKSLVRDALWVHGHFSAPRAMLYVVFVLIIGLGTFLIWKDPVQGARIVLPYLVRAFETLMFYAFGVKGLRAVGSWMGDGYIDPTMEYQQTSLYGEQASDRIDDPDDGRNGT